MNAPPGAPRHAALQQPDPVPVGSRVPEPTIPELPTQFGPRGIRFDFNQGARVLLPAGANWKVQYRDLDTDNILFLSENQGAMVTSTKRYYVRFGIDIWQDGQKVMQHEFDARDKKVLIHFYVGTLGDIIAWFPYAVKFQEQHGCKLTCALSELLIPLFEKAYPHIHFTSPDKVNVEEYYATYKMMMFFGDEERLWQPCEARFVGLHRSAAHLLGVDPSDMAPKIWVPDASRPIPEPYVCIATQATSQAKYWNNPQGWSAVINHVKSRGYRVFCIDQKQVHGTGLVWNRMPPEAEDLTGDHPLWQRARWLHHAAGFIGLSSGLSWLAWAAGAPVTMISGFTHPNNEFHTPYRVINYHTCNSCWNDPGLKFNHYDFLWCPRHAGTDRQFECTKLITPTQVIAAVDRMLDDSKGKTRA